jgi:hypothetical protein
MNVYDELGVDYDIPHGTNGGDVMMYESVATGTHDDDFNAITAMGYMGYSPVARTSTFTAIQQQHAATMVDFCEFFLKLPGDNEIHVFILIKMNNLSIAYETIGADDTTAIYNVAHTQTEHADQVIQSYLIRRWVDYVFANHFMVCIFRKCQDSSSMTTT